MTRLCPYCKSSVEEKLPGVWPFCSERCKMSDLGAWMQEDYRIPGRSTLEEELEEGADLDSEEAGTHKARQ